MQKNQAQSSNLEIDQSTFQGTSYFSKQTGQDAFPVKNVAIIS